MLQKITKFNIPKLDVDLIEQNDFFEELNMEDVFAQTAQKIEVQEEKSGPAKEAPRPPPINQNTPSSIAF